MSRVDVLRVLEYAATILAAYRYSGTANDMDAARAAVAELVAADEEYDAALAEQDASASYDSEGASVPRAVYERMQAATERRATALSRVRGDA